MFLQTSGETMGESHCITAQLPLLEIFWVKDFLAPEFHPTHATPLEEPLGVHGLINDTVNGC